MKITKLQILSFRNIKDITINLSDTNILFGPNGSGKSSVIHAIQMLLFGHCRHTDRRGVGAANLIMDGAKSAFVGACIGSDMNLELTISADGKQTFSAHNNGEQIASSRKEFWSYLHRNAAHATICAMPGEFIHSHELSDILAEMLSAALDVAAIEELAGDKWEWLSKYAVDQGIPLTSAANLAKLGKKAYADRRDVNRDEKSYLARLAVVQDTIHVVKDTQGRRLGIEDLDRIQRGVLKLANKKNDLLVAFGQAKAIGKTVDIEELENEVAQAKEDLALIRDTYDTALAVLSEAKQNVEVAGQDEGNSNHEKHLVSTALEKAIAEAEKESVSGDSCPMCGRKYTKDSIKKRMESLDAAIQVLIGERDDWISTHENEINRLNELRETLKTNQSEYDQAKSDLDRATRHVEETQTKLGAATVTDPSEAPKSVEDIQTEIDAVEIKYAAGADIVVQLSKLKELDDLHELRGEQVRAAGHLDWAVTQFKDGKALKGLLGDQLDEFITKVNKALHEFGPGLYLSAEVTGKSIDLYMQCPDSEGFRPLSQCSSGQQRLAEVALALAFSSDGVPVLIDDLNDLDHGYRRAFLIAMKEREGTLICACAWQQKAPVGPKIVAALAPAKVYWVEDGNVEVVG